MEEGGDCPLVFIEHLEIREVPFSCVISFHRRMVLQQGRVISGLLKNILCEILTHSQAVIRNNTERLHKSLLNFPQ